MNPDNIVYRSAIWIIPLVIAIVFHEVAHGWMAKWLGDPTAEEQKRLSFNPLRHVDPVGTLILPLGLAIAGAPVFGWAKPVPVVAQRLRNPRWGMVAVALAGPGMNLILATIAAILIGSAVALLHGAQPTGVAGFVFANLVNFLLVNVFLAIFNLLPIPILDGGVITMLLIESLIRRDLSLALKERVLQVGFLFLILLFAYVMYNDIMKSFGPG